MLKKRLAGEAGFTLVELLTTLGIIGILASIAIPQYARYREGAFDSRARSDLVNVAIAEEAYFVDHNVYITCDQTNCHTLLNGLNSLSQGVELQVTAAANGFTGTASHPQGSGQVFTWEQ